MRFHCFCDVHMCLQGYEYFIESSKLWRYSSRVVTRRDGANPSAILQITLCLSIYVYNFTCTLLCRIPVYLFRSFPGKGPRGNPGWIHCFFSQCHNLYHEVLILLSQHSHHSVKNTASQPPLSLPHTKPYTYLQPELTPSKRQETGPVLFVVIGSVVSEWVIKFNGLSWTADSEVHIVHISHVIIQQLVWTHI